MGCVTDSPRPAGGLPLPFHEFCMRNAEQISHEFKPAVSRQLFEFPALIRENLGICMLGIQRHCYAPIRRNRGIIVD